MVDLNVKNTVKDDALLTTIVDSYSMLNRIVLLNMSDVHRGVIGSHFLF